MMKYLFAAIDAREQRLVASRSRYDTSELKQIVIDTNEGLDEKDSLAEFTDTLERIVNEIRNTTEHSTAFLQKVRKTDVPDYYDVIKNPMDLGTLLKRVRQHAYHNKKEFADDLDLIWANCLLYNSHPTHPLRKSAEFLRAKANQLLEFISDPRPSKGPTAFVKQEYPSDDEEASDAREKTAVASEPPGPTPDSQEEKPTLKRRASGELNAPALLRTPSRMALFAELSEKVDEGSQANGKRRAMRTNYVSSLFSTLPNVDEENVSSQDAPSTMPNAEAVAPPTAPLSLTERLNIDSTLLEDAPDLAWWDAMQKPELLAAGVPSLHVTGSTMHEASEGDISRCLTSANKLLLARSGFDGVTKLSLDTLDDVLTCYIARIGAELRTASERHNTAAPADVFLRGLQGAGVPSYACLQEYAHEDSQANTEYKYTKLDRRSMGIDSYPPPERTRPPEFAPLTASGIGSLIGLLKNTFTERLKSGRQLTEDHALVESSLNESGTKNTIALRRKIDATGEIKR